MKCLKNTIIPMMLATTLSQVPAADALAHSLTSPQSGETLVQTAPLPALPEIKTTYANINAPDTRLTFSQMQNQIPGIFYNTAEGAPTLDSIFIVHKEMKLAINGQESDGNKLANFLNDHKALRDIAPSRKALNEYVARNHEVGRNMGAFSTLLDTPFSAFTITEKDKPTFSIVNMSDEAMIHNHFSSTPGYQALTQEERRYVRHFMHAHEMSHTHRAQLAVSNQAIRSAQDRSDNASAKVRMENYADVYGFLSTLRGMHAAGASPDSIDKVTAMIIEYRNMESFYVYRGPDGAYHTHDADIALMATQSLFKDNPHAITEMSEADLIRMSNHMSDAVYAQAKLHYNDDTRAPFTTLSATERTALANGIINDTANAFSLNAVTPAVFPDILKESMPNLMAQGLTPLASYNPNNPADPGRLYFRQGNQEQPFLLVENQLVRDDVHMTSALRINNEANKITNLAYNNALPDVRPAWEQAIKEAFSEQGLPEPTLLEDKNSGTHTDYVLTLPLSMDSPDMVSKVEAAFATITAHPHISPVSNPIATPTLLSMLDNTRHLDERLFDYPDLHQQALSTLFPDGGDKAFTVPEQTQQYTGGLPPPPMAAMQQAADNKAEKKPEAEAALAALRPRP